MVVWRANFARYSGCERVEGRGEEAGGEEKRWGRKEVGGRGRVVRGGGWLRGGALLEKLVSLTIGFCFLTVKLVLMTIIAI